VRGTEVDEVGCQWRASLSAARLHSPHMSSVTPRASSSFGTDANRALCDAAPSRHHAGLDADELGAGSSTARRAGLPQGAASA